MSLSQLAGASETKISEFERILCFYANFTSQTQIVRIMNIPASHFEQVVFPGQRLLFEAEPKAQLEIQTFLRDKEIRTDKIVCNCLEVNKSREIKIIKTA